MVMRIPFAIIGLTLLAACGSDKSATTAPAETFSAALNGANERPTATTTGATGTSAFVVSANGDTVRYTVTISGLSAAPSGLHIHGPATKDQTAGVIENLGFTAGVQSGTISTGSFNRNSSNFATAAVKYDSLLYLMRHGLAYVNVHSTGTYAAGEIRGQVASP
jgi:hypothetical protein